MDFFHGGGVGLEYEYMCSGNAVFLRSIISLVDTGFENLLQLYEMLKSGQNDLVLKIEHVLKLIDRTAYVNKDKQARDFLKTYFKETEPETNSSKKKTGFFAKLKKAVMS